MPKDVATLDFGILPGTMTVCFSDAAYKRYMKSINFQGELPVFIPEGAHACVSAFVASSTNAPTYVIKMDGEQSLARTPTQVMALFTHECMHVWQGLKEDLREKGDPGREIEAYALQSLSQFCIDAWVDWAGEHAEKNKKLKSPKRKGVVF